MALHFRRGPDPRLKEITCDPWEFLLRMQFMVERGEIVSQVLHIL